jgi:hypothetical protein
MIFVRDAPNTDFVKYPAGRMSDKSKNPMSDEGRPNIWGLIFGSDVMKLYLLNFTKVFC